MRSYDGRGIELWSCDCEQSDLLAVYQKGEAGGSKSQRHQTWTRENDGANNEKMPVSYRYWSVLPRRFNPHRMGYGWYGGVAGVAGVVGENRMSGKERRGESQGTGEQAVGIEGGGVSGERRSTPAERGERVGAWEDGGFA